MEPRDQIILRKSRTLVSETLRKSKRIFFSFLLEITFRTVSIAKAFVQSDLVSLSFSLSLHFQIKIIILFFKYPTFLPFFSINLSLLLCIFLPSLFLHSAPTMADVSSANLVNNGNELIEKGHTLNGYRKSCWYEEEIEENLRWSFALNRYLPCFFLILCLFSLMFFMF